MKKVKLTFTERFHLVQLMPEKDSRMNLIARKDVLNKLEFEQKEFKDHEFKNEEGRMTWKEDEKPKTIEFEFSSIELDYVKQKLKEADTNNILDNSLLNAWDKIM